MIARREAEQAKAAAPRPARARPRTPPRCSARSSAWPPQWQRVRRARADRPRPPAQPQAKAEAVREPRHGFDDASQPLAILGLDGKFKELNPSFARLVGYQEHEFAKAAWPSPHDRQVYKQQQEDFRLLVNGELETVNVQSTYMHGQGLMVPVVGELTLVQGEDGLPSHVLLTAEDRAPRLMPERTPGARARRGARRRSERARAAAERAATAPQPPPPAEPRPARGRRLGTGRPRRRHRRARVGSEPEPSGPSTPAATRRAAPPRRARPR